MDIKEIRTSLGYTGNGQSFAADLGVSWGALRKWESGEREPAGSATTLIRLYVWLDSKGLLDDWLDVKSAAED